MTSNFPPKGHLQHCLIEDKVSFYKFKDEIIAWLMGTNFGEVILELGAFAPKAAAEPSKSSKHLQPRQKLRPKILIQILLKRNLRNMRTLKQVWQHI